MRGSGTDCCWSRPFPLLIVQGVGPTGAGQQIVIAVLASSSLVLALRAGIEGTVSNCLHITLATVGYGDITAATELGHTLGVLEALVGQIYLVTIVSLIVTNLKGRARGI